MPNSLYRMPVVYLFLACVFCYSCSFLFVVFCVFVFFFCSHWSLVDVPLISFCPADHVPDWQPRIVLGMVEARSVNVKKSTTTTTHTSTYIVGPKLLPLRKSMKSSCHYSPCFHLTNVLTCLESPRTAVLATKNTCASSKVLQLFMCVCVCVCVCVSVLFKSEDWATTTNHKDHLYYTCAVAKSIRGQLLTLLLERKKTHKKKRKPQTINHGLSNQMEKRTWILN